MKYWIGMVVIIVTVVGAVCLYAGYTIGKGEAEPALAPEPEKEVIVVEFTRECPCPYCNGEPLPEAEPSPQYYGFDADDVTKPSGLTEQQLCRYLETRFPTYLSIAPILAANDQYVNAVFALAVLRTESGSDLSIFDSCNVGSIKNFYTGEYVRYESIEQGTEAFIQLLRNSYLDPNGCWYNGKSVEGIRQHYNHDSPEWTDSVIEIMEEIDESIRK